MDDDLHAALLRDIDAFLEANRMADSTFGKLAVNDGKFVKRLRARENVTFATAQKVRDFIADRVRPLASSEAP